MNKDLYEDDEKYLYGKENWLIRAYFYLSNGLNIVNESRNLFLGIIAIYIALKLTNIWWMVGMAIPSIVILTLMGYYTVHRMSKVNEWLSMRFSTHFGIKTFNYNEDNNKLLTEIRDLLKNNANSKTKKSR